MATMSRCATSPPSTATSPSPTRPPTSATSSSTTSPAEPVARAASAKAARHVTSQTEPQCSSSLLDTLTRSLLLGAVDYSQSGDVRAYQVVPDQHHWTIQ